MANKKITDLPELAEAPNANDLFEIVDVSTGVSKRIKAQYLGGGSSTTPTLQEVTDVGNEIISDDELQKIVIDKVTQTIRFYTRAFVTDLFVLITDYTQAGLYIDQLHTYGANKITLDAFSGLVLDDGGGNVVSINSNYATKNNVDFATIDDIPSKTSDLINDGDDGNPFISLLDLPSNIIFYPTNVASDISGHVKIVTSITDPSYNTTDVDV